jgi:hypothetical protein
MIPIDWHDLEVSLRLNDGDVVSVTYSPAADPNTIEIDLALAAHKTWWKEVQMVDNTGAEVFRLEVHDGSKQAGPAAAQAVDVEVGGSINLWKAKAFGVHTPMYTLADLEYVRGKRVSFRWSAD